MQDLSSRPGIEPVPPAVEAQSLNHCTAREVPPETFLVAKWPVGCHQHLVGKRPEMLPAMHGQPPTTKNYPTRNSNSDKVETP